MDTLTSFHLSLCVVSIDLFSCCRLVPIYFWVQLQFGHALEKYASTLVLFEINVFIDLMAVCHMSPFCSFNQASSDTAEIKMRLSNVPKMEFYVFYVQYRK